MMHILLFKILKIDFLIPSKDDQPPPFVHPQMDEIINKFTKKSEDKPTNSNSSKFDELYNQSAILEKHKQFVKPRLAVSLNSSYN